jgi:hypothetical protein
MLIPGKKSPGMNIDVFLRPLIEELKELGNTGVDCRDVKEKENFTLCAMLLWTINDFPAYAMLSGSSTKGKFACPYYHKDTNYLWLKHGKKYCYMGPGLTKPPGSSTHESKKPGGLPVKPAGLPLSKICRHGFGVGTGPVHVPGWTGSTGNRSNRTGSHRFCEPCMGHRRFLPLDHPWRMNKMSFNNEEEIREALVPLSGQAVLDQYATFDQVKFGKDISKKRKRDEDARRHNWRKKSIFFELPYWLLFS